MPWEYLLKVTDCYSLALLLHKLFTFKSTKSISDNTPASCSRPTHVSQLESIITSHTKEGKQNLTVSEHNFCCHKTWVNPKMLLNILQYTKLSLKQRIILKKFICAGVVNPCSGVTTLHYFSNFNYNHMK